MGIFVWFLLSAVGCASNPVEVGKVEWGRDLEEALAESQKSKKPVFALFQEVPG